MNKLGLIFLSWFIVGSLLNAQVGKQGNFIFSGDSIRNEYTVLMNDALAGESIIRVQNSILNANNRFDGPLEKGDLLFIIQMQGAVIKHDEDNIQWGEILDYSSCGNFEWAEVLAVEADEIILTCPLKNSYSMNGKTQVLRVPRYLTLTLLNNRAMSPPEWNGSIGGVVAIEAQERIELQGNGRIFADGLGFRGGRAISNVSVFGGLAYTSSNEGEGAEKGEGIGGSVTDYDNLGGRYCRAPAANGGGGGNSHNAGGGGGSNAGDLTNYTGKGIAPTTNANWIQAWELEQVGLSTAISSGGGRGGYSFSANNLNALNIAPNNSSWGGDWRRDNGGMGGRPLIGAANKLFMGGGGGAGNQNNNQATDGARGGGIVAIRCYGEITGTGSISSNGGNALNTGGGFQSGTDGAGGGGGGGAVYIESTEAPVGISISVVGGKGGNQDVLPFVNEAEGPGGGGAGGFVSLSHPFANVNLTGGLNGTTDSNGLTEFTPNGATRGGAGFLVSTVPIPRLPQIEYTPTCGAGLNAFSIENLSEMGVQNYFWNIEGNSEIVESNSFEAEVDETSRINLSACQASVSVQLIQEFYPETIAQVTENQIICGGESVSLLAEGGENYLWLPADGLNNNQIPNPVALVNETTSYIVVVTNSFGCEDSATVTIEIGGQLQITLTPDTSICQGETIALEVLGGEIFTWDTNPFLSEVNVSNPIANPTESNWFYVNVSTNSGCNTRDSVFVEVNMLQILEIIGDSFFCSTQGANLSLPGVNMVFWSPTTGLSNENGIETVATPTEPTNYVANYFDGNGCEGLTEPFEVIPGAFPVAAFTWEQISNYEVVFSNFSENADEVVWLIENVTYTTGGNENVTHDFPNEGFYPISMIVQNDCGDDTLSMTIEVLKQTSTFDLQTYKSLTFYPNPANDYVTIMFDENNHGDRLIIRDLSGRVIENVRITELNQKIDVSKFNAGIYFADVINNGTLYRGRFVISHTN